MSSTGIPEKVHLSGKELMKLTAELARGMEPFVQYTVGEGFEAAGNAISEAKIHQAVNATLVEAKANWCDRCVVMALHNKGVMSLPTLDAATLYERCSNDEFLKGALNEAPPEPSFRIQASDCTACPAGSISDASGVCQPCPVGEVVGNSCNQCMSDVVLDGATMDLTTTLDVTAQPAGDNCPNTFWVEVQNPSALYTRDIDSFGVSIAPLRETAQSCAGPWSLSKGFPDPATGYYTETTATGAGGFPVCDPDAPLCLSMCLNMPEQSLTQTEAAASVVRFGTPVVATVRMTLAGQRDVDPPK